MIFETISSPITAAAMIMSIQTIGMALPPLPLVGIVGAAAQGAQSVLPASVPGRLSGFGGFLKRAVILDAGLFWEIACMNGFFALV